MPFGMPQSVQKNADCGALPHANVETALHLFFMSILTPIPPALPFHKRAFFSIPLVGWLARDVMYGDPDNIWYFLVIVVTLLIGAVITWGLPALVLAAVGFVPIYFGFLIFIASPYMPND